LTLLEVPMVAGSFGEEDIVRALRAVLLAPKPVLIHCQHGSDRTGVVAAMYRIVFEGWTKEDAVDELRHGGFGFHVYYVNIPAFVRGADVERIKARLENREERGGRAAAFIRPAAQDAFWPLLGLADLAAAPPR